MLLCFIHDKYSFGKGVFTVVELMGFHSAAQRLRSTICLRVIRNAWHFRFDSALVFTAQWFRLGGRVVHPLIGRYAIRSIYDYIELPQTSWKALFKDSKDQYEFGYSTKHRCYR